MPARRIGLLGGSFNPAHAGHLHISREAIKRLGLDEVWWLVSPQNPLKASSELAPYATRLAKARAMATDPRIHVSDIESRQGLYYTIDTLTYLLQHEPHKFVWLMGADNLAHFHRWRAWRRIARLVPIAVLDRAPYALRALNGPFARWMRGQRSHGRAVRQLADAPAPAWAYLTIPRHSLSATQLRKTLGQRAFMVHT